MYAYQWRVADEKIEQADADYGCHNGSDVCWEYC
jgi:hypothetical protein